MKKTKGLWGLLLALVLSVAMIPAAGKSRAAGATTVSDADGLAAALAGETADITVSADIAFPAAQSIAVRGEKRLTLSGRTIEWNGSTLSLDAAADLTVTGGTMTQSGGGGLFLLKGAAKLTLYKTTVTAPDGGKVIHGYTGNGLTHVVDSTIDCGENGYAFSRGNFVLEGASRYTGKTIYVADTDAPYIYDFRNTTISATPTPAEVEPLDKIELAVSNAPTRKKGTGAATELPYEIVYTLDGSDPLRSDAAFVYDEPFYILVSRTVRVGLRCNTIERRTIDAFTYDLYPNAQPDTLDGFVYLEDVEVGCGRPLDPAWFPEIVELELENSANRISVLADWGDAPDRIYDKEGEYIVTAEVVLPDFIDNPNDEKPTHKIIVRADGIRDFTLQAYESVQEGKNSVLSGAAVGELTAAGGDNTRYAYAFVDGDNDNGAFTLDGNLLRVGKNTLRARSYTLTLAVESGGKRQEKTFTLTVKPAGERFVVADPYHNVDWTTVAQVKTATHNHTENTNNGTGWSDNVSDTPRQRIEYYKGLGYGAVVIADHDYVSYAADDYVGTGILGMQGSELSKNQHLLSYDCDYWDHKGQGTAAKWTYEENVVNIREAGGFAYLAHPCRNDRGNHLLSDHQMWYDIVEKYPWVYGMEVLNAGQFTRNHSEGLWDEILTRGMPTRNLWGAASDDAHSNAAAGTGWNTLLVGKNEHTDGVISQKLQNGEFYFSTYRVVIGKDDHKTDPGVPAPIIRSIVVDGASGTITIEAQGATAIEWISQNGAVVATGKTIDVNATYGTGKYVRARLLGAGGQSLTQPFGLYTVDETLVSVTDGKLTFDPALVRVTENAVGGKAVENGAPLLEGVTYYAVGIEGTEAEAKAQTIALGQKPSAPIAEVEETTESSIRLKSVEGGEYRLGDGDWQSAPLFENLSADTEYSLYVRIAATDLTPPSDPSEARVRTKAAKPADDTDGRKGCGCGGLLGGGLGGLGLLPFAAGVCLAVRRRKKRDKGE